MWGRTGSESQEEGPAGLRRPGPLQSPRGTGRDQALRRPLHSNEDPWGEYWEGSTNTVPRDDRKEHPACRAQGCVRRRRGVAAGF